MSAISDNRKGFEELSLALEKILNANSIEALTVVPNKQEGLSNVIMENLSCSTPVVAFDIVVIQI